MNTKEIGELRRRMKPDRTNLTVAFPGFVRLTVRSIPWRDAQKCFEFLERSRIL